MQLAHWPALLDLFGIDLADPVQQERFYLYISVWSLEVALFFANTAHHQLKTWFLRDAQRAFARQHPDRRLFTEPLGRTVQRASAPRIVFAVSVRRVITSSAQDVEVTWVAMCWPEKSSYPFTQ